MVQTRRKRPRLRKTRRGGASRVNVSTNKVNVNRLDSNRLTTRDQLSLSDDLVTDWCQGGMDPRRLVEIKSLLKERTAHLKSQITLKEQESKVIKKAIDQRVKTIKELQARVATIEKEMTQAKPKSDRLVDTYGKRQKTLSKELTRSHTQIQTMDTEIHDLRQKIIDENEAKTLLEQALDKVKLQTEKLKSYTAKAEPSLTRSNQVDPDFDFLLSFSRDLYEKSSISPDRPIPYRNRSYDSETGESGPQTGVVDLLDLVKVRSLSPFFGRMKTMPERLAGTAEQLVTVDKRFHEKLKHEYGEAYHDYIARGDNFKPFDMPFPLIAQMITLEQVKGLLASNRMLPSYHPNAMPPVSKDARQKEAYMLFLFKRRMGIEASTHSNVCSFVSHYCGQSPMGEPFLFSEGLMRTLQDVHRSINERFQQKLQAETPGIYTKSVWVHSGGNLFVLIASMLLYMLIDIPGHPDSLMERIKQKFRSHPGYDEFMTQLHTLVENKDFLDTLIDIANKLSDIDLLFMTGEKDIRTLDSPFLQVANVAAAETLRDLLRAPPFVFPPFRPFTGNSFLCTSGISPERSDQIRYGEVRIQASQTSSRIDDVVILLNRIKLIPALGEECGEFIDLCMASLENATFREKLVRFMMGSYYTLDMLIQELEAILRKPPDEKTPRRRVRLGFSLAILPLPGINDLVRLIGRAISNERIEASIEWE